MQSIWISFLLNKGRAQAKFGVFPGFRSPLGGLTLAVCRVETALVAKIKGFSETGFLNGAKHVRMGYSVKCAKLSGGHLPKTQLLPSPGLLPFKLRAVGEEKHFGFTP